MYGQFPLHSSVQNFSKPVESFTKQMHYFPYYVKIEMITFAEGLGEGRGELRVSSYSYGIS